MRIQTAYESLLRSNPMAGGTVQISFDITPSGSVTNVSVSAPGDLASLAPTIQSAVAGLNFGPADGQTSNLTVQVPFNLLPPE
jgi:outer membrane biosynthesis protein TonB